MIELILGEITLLPDKAIVHKIEKVKKFNTIEEAEAVGEKLLYKYSAYLIPKVFLFPIIYE
jgi:hypothetical protein